MTAMEVLNHKPVWPESVKAMFPALAIFYKPNIPKERKGQIRGYKLNGKFTSVGNPKTTPIYKKHKRRTTRQQNNYSVVSCLLMSPDDWGTAARTLKHKGYSKMVSLVFATEAEIKAQKECFRYHFIKYKTFGELYNLRKVFNPEFADICYRLDKAYNCKATGQIKLI